MWGGRRPCFPREGRYWDGWGLEALPSGRWQQRVLAAPGESAWSPEASAALRAGSAGLELLMDMCAFEYLT